MISGLIYQGKCLHGNYDIPTVYNYSKNGYHGCLLHKVHPFDHPDHIHFLLSCDNVGIYICVSSC